MCFDLLVPSGQEVGIEDPGELVDGWGLKPPHCLAGCRILCMLCVRIGYRLQKPYRGIPRYSATYRGTYRGIP